MEGFFLSSVSFPRGPALPGYLLSRPHSYCTVALLTKNVKKCGPFVPLSSQEFVLRSEPRKTHRKKNKRTEPNRTEPNRNRTPTFRRRSRRAPPPGRPSSWWRSTTSMGCCQRETGKHRRSRTPHACGAHSVPRGVGEICDNRLCSRSQR